MLRYLFSCLALLFIACKSSDNKIDDEALSSQTWLFDTKYIKTINDSSWESISITALNDYNDFKIDLSYISTGKPRTCGLYAKGVLVNNDIYDDSKMKDKSQFMLRPNVIPSTTILISKDNRENEKYIIVEISNMTDFIAACGDSHQYVEGKYISSEG